MRDKLVQGVLVPIDLTTQPSGTFYYYLRPMQLWWYVRGVSIALHKRGLLKGVNCCELDFCKFCMLGKQSRVKFKTSKHKTEVVLNYVHSDVWSPTRQLLLGVSQYLITFIDDFQGKYGYISWNRNLKSLPSSRCGKRRLKTGQTEKSSIWDQRHFIACKNPE